MELITVQLGLFMVWFGRRTEPNWAELMEQFDWIELNCSNSSPNQTELLFFQWTEFRTELFTQKFQISFGLVQFLHDNTVPSLIH